MFINVIVTIPAAHLPRLPTPSPLPRLPSPSPLPRLSIPSPLPRLPTPSPLPRLPTPPPSLVSPPLPLPRLPTPSPLPLSPPSSPLPLFPPSSPHPLSPPSSPHPLPPPSSPHPLSRPSSPHPREPLSDARAQELIDQALESGSQKQRNVVAVITGITGSGKTWLLNRLFYRQPPDLYSSTGVAEQSFRGLLQHIGSVALPRLLAAALAREHPRVPSLSLLLGNAKGQRSLSH